MKISASLYSNKVRSIEEAVHELDLCSVDCFHIDCNDNLGVFADIEKIRTFSPTAIDLHIISDTPEKYHEPVEKAAVSYVTYQYENLKDRNQVPATAVAKQGLAITSETPIEVFDPFADRCEFLLFMTTVPGQSGGKFQKVNFRKIREFRKRHPQVKVHVDGGVTDEISFILRNMGVSLVVSGSYLMNNQSIGAAMLRLKSEVVGSHFYVGDFMIDKHETPIIPLEGSTVFDALETIESYGLGLTSVVTTDGKLAGIVTNADIRRGLLRHRTDFNQLGLAEILNPNPVFVYDDMTVSEMIDFVKNQSFPILYLPVLNRSKEVVGTLTFHNLIKGEG